MDVAAFLRSRNSMYRAAWILFGIGLLLPSGGWGVFSGATLFGDVIVWSRALPASIDGIDAFRAFALALSFFSVIVFLATRTIVKSRLHGSWQLLLAGSVVVNASLVVLFPRFLLVLGFWFWLVAWGTLAWALLIIPETRPEGETEIGPAVPTMISVWLGFFAFWMAVTVLNHLAPLPPEEVVAPTEPVALLTRFNDQGGLFTVDDRIRFDGLLSAFEKKTSCQIAVAAYPHVPAGPIEEFTLKTAEATRLGRKGSDNGAILFTFADARVARLEVGYGLEGAIPDITAHHILEQQLGPHFAKGDFSAGLDGSLGAIFAALGGEYAIGRSPGLLTRSWRLLVRMGKVLRFEWWPSLRRMPAAGRAGLGFWGGLLGVGCFSGVMGFARLCRLVVVGFKNLSHGKDTELGHIDVLGMRDTLVVFAFVAILLVGGAAFYMTAGGGGFGGAGALIRW